MREFLCDESGHSDTGAAIAVALLVLVVLVLLLQGGLFRGTSPEQPDLDIKIRPGT